MFCRVSGCFHVIHYTVHNTWARTHGHIPQEATETRYCTLCVQLKPNGDFGSLLVFTRETSCIFPSATLKICCVVRGGFERGSSTESLFSHLSCTVEWRRRRRKWGGRASVVDWWNDGRQPWGSTCIKTDREASGHVRAEESSFLLNIFGNLLHSKQSEQTDGVKLI